MKAITKEEHQSSVCHQDCYNKKEWTREMPYVLGADKYFSEARTLFICLSCVHFVGFDNMMKEV